MLDLQNTEFNFTLFPCLVKPKEPDGAMDINQLIEIIKYGYLKDVIVKLRGVSDKLEYSKIKQREIPCVTLSGIFTERDSLHLKEHSGLIQIDIDDVEDYDLVFKKITEDTYTYVCFRSPGGKGIKAVVKINPSEDTHLEQFYALERYYLEKLNIKIDGACKDVARSMLLSYDPDIFCNPFSDVYEELYLPKVSTPKTEVAKTGLFHAQVNSSNAEDLIKAIINEVENNKIDITTYYEDWIRVGYALHSVLGENGRAFFHRFSAIHPSYDQAQCDKQFTLLAKRNNGAIGIGTLVYLAKEHQIVVNFNKPQSAITPVAITQSSITQSLSEKEKKLFEALRKLRLKITAEEGIKAFMVFGNSTLNELVRAKPMNMDQLLAVKGIGQKKAQWFGQDVLNIIKEQAG